MHSAESLLKCFTLLCIFLNQSMARSGLPRTGYTSLSQPLNYEWLSHSCGEVRKALCRITSAGVCSHPALLEHHCLNWNLGKYLPHTESVFLFSLKPVRNVVFWKDAWELFTNLVTIPNNWDSTFTVSWHSCTGNHVFIGQEGFIHSLFIFCIAAQKLAW